MKIAIHDQKGSFSDNWISYCKENGIQYKIVNCYKSDIIQQLTDCDALMWHFHQSHSKDALFAKQLLFSVQACGKKVFPDYNTVWHFDDKVGQKYLLESIGAPLVPSFVFYDDLEAIKWVEQAKYPLVFKLRGGAGSANVILVKTKNHATRLVKRAFGRGFRRYDPYGVLKEQWRRYKLGKVGYVDLLEALGRFFIKTKYEKILGKDRGYVYFQEFIEGCTFDIRVKIVAGKCWVYKRLVRENDFRASGSDLQVFSPEGVPLEIIDLSFKLSEQLHLQSVAFDFLLSKDHKPYLLEISYGFGYKAEQHYAYWDSNMTWHNERFNPFGWMVDSVVKSIAESE